MYQKIVYSDFLPLVIGLDHLKKYQLLFTPGSHYNQNVDPSILNSFGTAAFRFGHSLIQNTFDLTNNNGENSEIKLRDQFFNPFVISQNENLDKVWLSVVYIYI